MLLLPGFGKAASLRDLTKIWDCCRIIMHPQALGKRLEAPAWPSRIQFRLFLIIFSSMSADDVQELLDLAIAKTGITKIKVRHRPRLLSDNGPCYVSGQLKNYLKERKIDHIRGRPYHPMTQGKIERFHRSLKNVINLDKYYYPWELEKQLEEFVNYYNHERYHESINNLTPADVYAGRKEEVLNEREEIKLKTMKMRRMKNLYNHEVEMVCN